MARFVNETGSVLTSFEHGWKVGPNEELDWPGYDPETHGPVAGCRLLDEPAAAKRRQPKTADEGDPDGSDSTGTGDPDSNPDSSSAADAAGEENQS